MSALNASSTVKNSGLRCLSTRGQSSASLSEAIAAGLASDGGLFLPEVCPTIALTEPSESLAELATALLTPFFAGDRLESELKGLCTRAFTFDAPLHWLEPDTALLELFHGPTAAFKDFAARFLAETLSCLQPPSESGSKPEAVSEAVSTVLVATSGDTGAAVAAAFHRRPGFRVVILYPDGRVSARQAHQLGSFGDNVACLKVAGSFDDCQAMVKAAFADASLREQLHLTSANSISLGRLLPQMAYFARAGLLCQRQGLPKPTIVVPTGNLGNAFACLMARKAGLPIGEVILATNANRVIPEYLSTGLYQPQPSVATLANAMDVGNPSNAERLRAWFPDREGLRGYSIDDEAIRQTIVETDRRFGVAICPHTACGVEALRRARAEGLEGPAIIAATAHPAKFETIVEPLLGRAVPPPPALAEMLARPSSALPLSSSLEALKEALIPIPVDADRLTPSPSPRRAPLSPQAR